MLFKHKQHLDAHVRRVHDGRFRYPCKVCGKGVEKKSQVKQHEDQHLLETVGEKETVRLLIDEPEALRAQVVTGPHSTRCSASGCRIPKRSADKANAWFQCDSCGMRWHHTCLGYSTDVEVLPKIFCTSCLAKMHMPITACLTALSHRRLLEAYVEDQGWSVHTVASDGWCLAACVAKSVGGTKETVFEAAVKALSKMDISALPEGEQASVRKDCDRCLTHPIRDMARDLAHYDLAVGDDSVAV